MTKSDKSQDYKDSSTCAKMSYTTSTKAKTKTKITRSSQ